MKKLREKVSDNMNENGEVEEEVQRNTIKLNDIITMAVITILYGIRDER